MSTGIAEQHRALTRVDEQHRALTRVDEPHRLSAAPGIVRVLIARRGRQRSVCTCGWSGRQRAAAFPQRR